MADLKDILSYLCTKYPHSNELSKARITKMLFLADWESNLRRGKSISNVEWYFNHYGPYVDDIVNKANEDFGFSVLTTKNIYGDDKQVITYKGEKEWKSLTNEDTKILDEIINKTHKMYWNSFIQYVYSTYPVKYQNKYDKLDLKKISEKYKEQELDGAQ